MIKFTNIALESLISFSIQEALLLKNVIAEITQQDINIIKDKINKEYGFEIFYETVDQHDNKKFDINSNFLQSKI